MRRLKFASVCGFICLFQVVSTASAQVGTDRRTPLLDQEKKVGLTTASIVSPETVSSLYTQLYSLCAGEGGVELANTIGKPLQDKVSGIIDRFLERMERDRLSVSAQYQLLTSIWSLIKRIHPKINIISDTKKFCEQKALVYLIQIQIAGFLGQAEQILNLKEPSVQDYEAILTKISAMSNAYPSLHSSVQSIPFQNISGAVGSGLTQIQLGVKLGQLYKQIFVFALSDLQQKGIFTQVDIDRISKVTTFVFRKDCETFHGNVQIKKVSDLEGNVVDLSLERVVLYVNVCYQEYVVDQMEQIVKDLMYHELSHYIYYFKDSNPSEFEAICRQNDKRKLMCGESAFPSSYAMSMDEEDYAEVAADRFQGRTTAVDPLLQQKYQYFDMRFGK